jgi:zinc transport system ATP-binding protein
MKGLWHRVLDRAEAGRSPAPPSPPSAFADEPFPDLPLPLPDVDPPPALIEARDVSLKRGGRRVLDRVDVAIHDGEIVTIVGPNGAGKSTLLRTLMGLQRPTTGQVIRKPGVTVGYLPQKVHLDPVMPLTVRRLLTLTRRHPADALRRALSEVGILHLIDAQVHGLSGGELQRALLARAILAKPSVLFLDEPTQGIDYAGQIEMYDLIGSLRYRHRCSVVMISHDLHVVTAATDRVICLHHHVCCHGRPETITQHPEYQRLFGAAAAGHLAVYSHHHDHRHDSQGHPDLACGHAGQAVEDNTRLTGGADAPVIADKD